MVKYLERNNLKVEKAQKVETKFLSKVQETTALYKFDQSK